MSCEGCYYNALFMPCLGYANQSHQIAWLTTCYLQPSIEGALKLLYLRGNLICTYAAYQSTAVSSLIIFLIVPLLLALFVTLLITFLILSLKIMIIVTSENRFASIVWFLTLYLFPVFSLFPLAMLVFFQFIVIVYFL